MDCQIHETLLNAYISSTADYLEAVNVLALASGSGLLSTFFGALMEDQVFVDGGAGFP